MADSPKTVIDVTNSPKGLGWMRAVSMIVMGCVGVGILALPRTAAFAGWLAALLGLIFAGLVNLYNNIILWRTLFLTAQGEDRVARSYEHAVRSTFGVGGSIYSGIIVHVLLISVCVAMLILMGSTTEAMTRVLNRQAWIALWTLVGIPFSWIKEVKDVGFIAVFGVTSASAMVIVIIVASADRMVTDGISESLAVVPSDALEFIAALASYFYVYSFTAASPTICYHMTKPENFPKTVVVATIFITLLYSSVMELGYVGYGQFIATVDTIVDAISPPGQTLDVFGWLINITVLAVMLPHYLVQFTPTAKQIDRMSSHIGERKGWSTKRCKVTALVCRTLLVIAEGGLAIVIPKVSSIVSLIGAFCSTQVTILFPIACYMKVKRQHQLPWPLWEILVHALFTMVAFVIMGIGIYGAIIHF
ncbi:amino acid transporter, putative [Perkinsus marinus ATCC 50983]|uniref:Amino acid transporter, putative n=1 Tax=Perkinsus marinus (strain ATCC 50983 / TXsc) TaxID=423536 RepID=C5LSH3_PERM5|nr:amino acid transporter, putative [Perkinsus marinus ATCC 50983]EER00214.1 amino acid transporter, putative [Perkinsus marinus ATCC 50983]|eukprot:XP_002767496.1 amino acid transporter, putative [Perkinsus marinus ATCC 50983]